MITFKSKTIQVFRTDKAHLIEFKRNNPYWFPASMLKCTEIDRIVGPFGSKPIYLCELNEKFIEDRPGLIPTLTEKEAIYDVKFNQ